MPYINKVRTEKVTLNIPSDLKKELQALKETQKVSLNTIYVEALRDYVKKQELQKWEEGAKKAAQNSEYLAESKELANGGVEFYDY